MTKKTQRRRKLRKTRKVRKGGVLPVPNDEAIKVSVPVSSDNEMAFSGGKRRKSK
jgi:hypothetical protein